MKKEPAKYLLIGLFMLLLWAPMLQQKLHVFKGGELRGAFVKPGNISISFKNWFNGTYAPEKEDYLRTAFGFQGDMVRLYNQIEYSVFKITNTVNVVIGKDDYIYEQRYIDSYYGKDFKGDDPIKERVKEIKQLQDTLKSHGVVLFIAYVPGKGTFYPEYIPDKKKLPKGRTNYQACIEASKGAGLNYIDFESYFLAMKDTSRYKLYPHGGIHWTYYGDVVAFDSILHYLRKNTSYKVPELKINSIQLSRQPRYRDNDACDALNIIDMPDKDTLAYPLFSLSDTTSDLHFMAIGDSYYWNMELYFSPLAFKNCAFWYYYGNIYYPHKPTLDIKEAHGRLKEILLSQNIICIMQTDAGLDNLGYAFIGEANVAFGKK